MGCLIFLPLIDPMVKTLARRLSPIRFALAADFHTLFNVATALLFILPLNWLADLLKRDSAGSEKCRRPFRAALSDDSVIDTPSVALACAARETLHMGDIVETMLRQAMTALMTNDRKLVAEVCQRDNAVVPFARSHQIVCCKSDAR
ncbi:MAG: PhoU domain-containing protein [Nitrosomonadales bacterium]